VASEYAVITYILFEPMTILGYLKLLGGTPVMLTAKNYFAEFNHSFLKNHSKTNYPNLHIDMEHLENVRKSLKESVHFSLPDGGKIFDDGFKGILNKEIHLPYPKITLEFYDPSYTETNDKKMLLVYEINREELLSESNVDRNMRKYLESITSTNVILMLYGSTIKQGWYLGTFSWVMSTEWDKKPENQEDEIIELVLENGQAAYGTISAFLTHSIEYVNKVTDINAAIATEVLVIRYMVTSLLEFIEALSCSNVKMENIQNEDKKLNKKRLAEKKLPFYETKVLTLEVPGETKVASESLGGSGVTQRQHLRRGHIRRLANGNNIWINSYIAGSAAKGVITKSYNLVKS